MTDGTGVTEATRLAAELLQEAADLGLRVAVAESLTGGLLADALVSVAGASRVFSGGIVAYDTSLKHSMLGVDSALLARAGPVDGEVAKQMAYGIRLACAVSPLAGGEAIPADIGLATTGVAGPGADPQTNQPAGTVWLGVSSRLGTRAVRLQLQGSRAEIRSAAVQAALGELAQALKTLQ